MLKLETQKDLKNNVPYLNIFLLNTRYTVLITKCGILEHFGLMTKKFPKYLFFFNVDYDILEYPQTCMNKVNTRKTEHLVIISLCFPPSKHPMNSTSVIPLKPECVGFCSAFPFQSALQTGCSELGETANKFLLYLEQCNIKDNFIQNF